MFRLILDSGATTCRYLFYEKPRRPLKEGAIKGLNYTEEGAAGIHRLITSLIAETSEIGHPSLIGIALAGAGRKEVAQNFMNDLRVYLPEGWGTAGLHLFHDGEAALWTVLGREAGVVTAAGTGSITFGRDADGRTFRAGGWGKLIGDEGSAYWIGIQALQSVLRSFDGREKETLMEEMIRKKLKLKNTVDLVAWVHAPDRGKEEVAELAPLVEAAAENGDLRAIEILDSAARELVDLTTAVLRQGRFPSPIQIGITGSIFMKNTRIRSRFSELFKAGYPESRIMPSREDNIRGAAALTEHLYRS